MERDFRDTGDRNILGIRDMDRNISRKTGGKSCEKVSPQFFPGDKLTKQISYIQSPGQGWVNPWGYCGVSGRTDGGNGPVR